ncbi:MAG: sulfatase-like hydrolase/transferase [Myxococcota bacterium]
MPYYQQSTSAEYPHDGREYLSRYAAEVRSLDHDLNELFGGLEERGISQDAVLVLTSDHGEALAGDHGYFFSHGDLLTEDQTHVPLMLSYPGCAGGTVSDRPVSTMDIAPTVLNLLGVPTESKLDGRDLLSVRAESVPRTVATQAPKQISIRRGSWKLAWHQEGTLRLFHIDSDPNELQDVAKKNPKVVAELRAELNRLRTTKPLAHPPHRQVNLVQGARPIIPGQ